MNIFKSIVGGVKKKIVDPFKRFVNRNKKALITAAILGATIYTGGALAGWWAGAGKLGAAATALAGTGKIAGISASALKGVVLSSGDFEQIDMLNTYSQSEFSKTAKAIKSAGYIPPSES